jgi:short-subunit dehydrogenase
MPQTIWITGASSGIGEALTKEYAKFNHTLIISSRSEKELERVRDEVKHLPAKIFIQPLDLEKFETLQSIVDQVLDKVSKVDILINNGGISQRGLALETPVSVDQRIMAVNYLGTVALTKALLPSMVKRKAGHIVTVTSLVGKFGTKKRSSYSASKHACHGFFDSLRSEVFEKNINVSIICPGFIRTNVSINALNEKGEKQGTMDETTGSGMLPEVFAIKMIKAIENKKAEAYIGGKETWGVHLKRFFPNLFNVIIRKAKVT